MERFRPGKVPLKIVGSTNGLAGALGSDRDARAKAFSKVVSGAKLKVRRLSAQSSAEGGGDGKQLTFSAIVRIYLSQARRPGGAIVIHGPSTRVERCGRRPHLAILRRQAHELGSRPRARRRRATASPWISSAA